MNPLCLFAVRMSILRMSTMSQRENTILWDDLFTLKQRALVFKGIQIIVISKCCKWKHTINIIKLIVYTVHVDLI